MLPRGTSASERERERDGRVGRRRNTAHEKERDARQKREHSRLRSEGKENNDINCDFSLGEKEIARSRRSRAGGRDIDGGTRTTLG